MKRSRLSALVFSAALESGCIVDTTENAYVPPQRTPVVQTTPDYRTASPPVEELKPVSLDPRYSTQKNGNLQYPLVSTAVSGTTLNMEEAAKARKAVELVINNDRKSGVKYNSFPEEQIAYQRVQAVMKIKLDEYTITAANMDESRKSEDESETYDVLFLTIKPNVTKNNTNVVTFEDTGLDGDVNFMESPREKAITLFGRKISANTNFSTRANRLGNKEIAQTLYMTALEKIIEFYEQKK